MENNSKGSVIIVGGGLVGTLCAYFLGRRGYAVNLYESRDDIRNAKCPRGRSINLSLSNRGRKALKKVGLEEKVLDCGVSMTGRRLHLLNGKQNSIPYDSLTNQCIYSVGRNFLNKFLLSAVESIPNVTLNFGCKLVDANLKTGNLTFIRSSTNEFFHVSADLMVGADGAFSSLCRILQHSPLFDYCQTYIDHGYVELSVSPSEGKLLTPNHLHVWPRGNFMLIALPNVDGSWTVTLFMPFEIFDTLNSKVSILKFFLKTFPDILPVIGEQKLVDDMMRTKPSVLVSVKCSKFHYGERFLLIGDAAHAVVPFYGQGMNAGFEDCTILDELLDKYGDNFAIVLEEFTKLRVKDAHAIADLAAYNYVEMRYLVTKPSYLIRKRFDHCMHKILKDKWQPLYYSVSFTNKRYHMCMKHNEWQNKIMTRSLFVIISIFSLVLFYLSP